MTKIGTYFKVSDNSGVKTIQAIGNLSKKSLNINIGDLIVGVIKNISSKKKHIFYSDIVYGVVIRLKKTFKKNRNNLNYSFNDNCVVLVDKNLNPIGSRIFGSIPNYIKEKNCLKLNSLTTDIV